MITPRVMSVTVGTSHPSNDRAPREAADRPVASASTEVAAPPPTPSSGPAVALPSQVAWTRTDERPQAKTAACLGAGLGTVSLRLTPWAAAGPSR